MRALAALGLALVALTGCDGQPPPLPSTGLVLTLHFNHYQVDTVSLSGSTFTTSRRFGPYVVAEDDLPRDSSVGFVFDAGDAGSAMICGESHDGSGNVLQQGCDTFDIIAAAVTEGSLTLVDPVP